MRFVVLFDDNPEKADIRPKLMPQHQAFLAANAASVLAAGPLTETGGAPAGGLWLVEAADAASVQRLVESDPFWPTGLRCSLRVLAWKQVFADGRSLPYSDASFDVAHASLVLHHLEPADVVALLREMNRVSRRGIVVNDLATELGVTEVTVPGPTT